MRRGARWLLNLGTLAVVLGLGKVHAAWLADDPYDFTNSSRFAWSLAYIALLAVAAYGVGLPDLARDRRSQMLTAAAGTGLGALGISVVQLILGSALLPRFVIFGSAALLVPWYLTCALVASGGHARGEERDRVVLVAREEDAAALRADLGRRPERPASLVGVLLPEQARSTPGHEPLTEAALRASVIVLSREAQADDSIVEQAAALHEAGVRVRTLSLFYEEWLGKLPLSELERVALMFDIGELHRLRYARVKRAFDVVIGCLATVLLGLLLPFLLIGNLAANRGPLFYRQARVGRGNGQFTILKLRTMRPGDGPSRWTARDDPRITPFGRILRRTHVDELPQAVNLLRGDLTVVGPRPEQPHYVEELTEKIRFYGLRHLVRPGITGWAQVKYGYAADERDALEKLQYEFYYLRHQGLLVDLRIIGRTLRNVLEGGGR